jgi:thiamine pyrophosphokinase
MVATILKLKRNNDYVKSVTIKYSNGTPYDLTGKEVHFAVKEITDISIDDSTAVIKKTITAFDAPITGQFDLVINAEDTEGLELQNYKFDFRIINTSTGKAVNTVTGTLQLSNIVTTE